MRTPSLAVLAALFALLAFVRPALVRAEEGSRKGDRSQTSGLGLALGVGTQTVFVGGQLLYYVQTAQPRWRVALHLGAGALPVPEQAGYAWGMNGGAFAAFGRRHRLVFGAEAGTFGWKVFYLHGQALARRQLPGAGLSVGWEWMAPFGFLVRGSIGPAFQVEPEVPLVARRVSAALVGGFQLGYKLW